MCKEKWENIITGKPKLKRKLFSTVNPNTKNEMPLSLIKLEDRN